MIQINNELRDKCYQIACNNGFHDKEYSDEHWLMLIITEISEAVEADRKGKHASINSFKEFTEKNTLLCDACFEADIKDSLEDELADVAIRILDLSGLRNIDITSYTITPIGLIPFSPFTDFAYSLCHCLSSDGELLIKLRVTFSWIKEYCDMNNIDLLKHIELKMKYNEARANLHGKKY